MYVYTFKIIHTYTCVYIKKSKEIYIYICVYVYIYIFIHIYMWCARVSPDNLCCDESVQIRKKKSKGHEIYIHIYMYVKVVDTQLESISLCKRLILGTQETLHEPRNETLQEQDFTRFVGVAHLTRGGSSCSWALYRYIARTRH